MILYYTARRKFDKSYNGEVMSWDKYIEWSKLTHLTELVSLDGMLNDVLFEPDRNNEEDWNNIVTDDSYETGFFTTLEYVLQRTKSIDKYNFLTVAIEPNKDCKSIPVDGFDFIGYDLLDKDYSISALTNCGGFDETFLPKDLNLLGLIDDFENAYDIKKRLLENNPEEYHADTNVIGVWRHKSIGR